jgi:hypothetical protein
MAVGKVRVQRAGQAAERHVPRGVVAAGERQLEGELVEAVPRPDRGQRGTAEQRRAQRDGQVPRHVVEPAEVGAGAPHGGAQVPQQLRTQVARGEVGHLEDAVDRGADLPPGGHRRERRAARGLGEIVLGRLVGEQVVLHLGADGEAGLARAGGQRGVRRAPPRPVQLAVEGAHLEDGRRRGGGRQRRGRAERRRRDADAAGRALGDLAERLQHLRVVRRARRPGADRALRVAVEQQAGERRGARDVVAGPPHDGLVAGSG